MSRARQQHTKRFCAIKQSIDNAATVPSCDHSLWDRLRPRFNAQWMSMPDAGIFPPKYWLEKSSISCSRDGLENTEIFCTKYRQKKSWNARQKKSTEHHCVVMVLIHTGVWSNDWLIGCMLLLQFNVRSGEVFELLRISTDRAKSFIISRSINKWITFVRQKNGRKTKKMFNKIVSFHPKKWSPAESTAYPWFRPPTWKEYCRRSGRTTYGDRWFS